MSEHTGTTFLPSAARVFLRRRLEEILGFLVLLLGACYFLALPSQIAQLLSTLLLTHAGDQVASLTQALRGATGFRFALRRSRALR